MILGIVGAEGAKFTKAGEEQARTIIRALLSQSDVTLMVSGGCHLGGADIYAEEEAAALGIPTRVHKPKQLTWDGGYKQRNILIAEDADVVHNIVVDVLPDSYDSMRFESCYHCKTKEHIKSGGCWTAKHAQKLGKKAEWHLVRNYTVQSFVPGNFTTSWKTAPGSSCPRCHSPVEFRLWESQDTAFEDEQYRCTNVLCGYSWWVESSDY